MHRFVLPVCTLLMSVALRAVAADSPAAPAADAPARKLFHVVAVKFKEGATKEQIGDVEKAFAALKEKIPGILSLDWGTNSSPEKLNKGFTHCFVLTFASEGDRDDYLTHAEHKAFGAVLGPVRDDVMVIDFWTEPTPAAAPTGDAVAAKLFHVVSFQFKERATKDQIAEIEKAFGELKTKIPNVVHLNWGTNISPEHKNMGFTHCFVLNFPNDAARDTYLTHPAHQAFVAILLPVMKEAMVIDFQSK